MPYSEMPPGAYDPIARVVDMDVAGILASIVSLLSEVLRADLLGGQGQGARPALRQGLQRLDDRRVVRFGPGSLHPADHHPAVGPTAAGKEMERCAAKGATSFAFSENPEPLGLPDYSRPGPLLGSGHGGCGGDPDGRLACTSARRPRCRSSPGTPRCWPTSRSARVRAAGTMLAWLFSDYFERMPGLKIALSEGNIGWMPYFIERAEQVIDKQRHWAKNVNDRVLQQRGQDRSGHGRPR